MKKQLQKAIQLCTIVCLSGILTVGCSASPASGSTDNPAADLSTSAAPDRTEAAQTEQAQDSADTDNSAKNPDTNTTQPDTVSDDTEGKWHVYPSDVAAAVDADFEGTVWKMDTNSFYIAPGDAEILENGAILAIDASPDAEIPDSDLVQVVFDENTHFYTRTIYDGGARYEDSDAAFKDIEKDQSVSLKGSFENDIFHATEIRISKVV